MAIPILPGTAVKYVNAYLVTRHFGGREEGGWWYNWLRCVASVPVTATRHIGCIPGHCGECDDARKRLDPNPASYCAEPHLIPIDPADVDAIKARLEEIFADDVEGDIYSVNGGQELCICVEDEIAESQSTERPRYE